MKEKPESLKALMNAPCAFQGAKRKEYPTVDCQYDCGNCDWNPREHKRRMEEGRFVRGKLRFERRFK